jgi:hypothetical protein
MIKRIKERAAAEGRELSSAELTRAVDEMREQEEEPLTVANNPAIKFPTNSEVRRRRLEESRRPRDSGMDDLRDHFRDAEAAERGRRR